MHSWNARSGTVLARNERHSYHHLHGYRPYPMLQKIDNEPTYPWDFPQVVNMTFVPQGWFDAVNPLVLGLNGPPTKINHYPYYVA